MPENTFVYPGYYTATLFIYNATVANTGYYMCTYETQEGELEAEPEEDNEAGIYVFVPGDFFIFYFFKYFFIFDTHCVWQMKGMGIQMLI